MIGVLEGFNIKIKLIKSDMDPRLVPNKEYMQEKGIAWEFAPPGRHEGSIERQNQTVTATANVIKRTLINKGIKIKEYFINHIVNNAVRLLNMRNNVKTGGITALEATTGRKPDKRMYEFPVGEVVVCKRPSETSKTDNRTEIILAMGKDVRGTLFGYNLETGKLVHRYQALFILDLTSELLAKINKCSRFGGNICS
jgi:hypothetical protein